MCQGRGSPAVDFVISQTIKCTQNDVHRAAKIGHTVSLARVQQSIDKTPSQSAPFTRYTKVESKRKWVQIE